MYRWKVSLSRPLRRRVMRGGGVPVRLQRQRHVREGWQVSMRGRCRWSRVRATGMPEGWRSSDRMFVQGIVHTWRLHMPGWFAGGRLRGSCQRGGSGGREITPLATSLFAVKSNNTVIISPRSCFCFKNFTYILDIITTVPSPCHVVHVNEYGAVSSFPLHFVVRHWLLWSRFD